MTFEEAEIHLIEHLKKEGFGVVTKLDLQTKFKEKLNKDFRMYKILGVCNPHIAFEALQLEDKIGTMLPCNFIIQEIDTAHTEIVAVDPVASMQAIENENLTEIAAQVQSKLKNIVEEL
ncbi:MAG: DUF302 domain-containing protein [Bacteroidales bacterium]|nr:DUF302 domain-containing protein [Bacteroidales bacterium]